MNLSITVPDTQDAVTCAAVAAAYRLDPATVTAATVEKFLTAYLQKVVKKNVAAVAAAAAGDSEVARVESDWPQVSVESSTDTIPPGPMPPVVVTPEE